MKITSAEFIKSVVDIKQCPNLNLPEFAFFWRSNVWKSSLINMLTQRKDLAKCSKIPWKTKLFNFFIINNSRVIVDLPWYGYAKSWEKERRGWLDFTQEFLSTRNTLKNTFLLIDGSIPPQKIDIEMIKCFMEEWIDFSIVFTKLDKSNQKDRSKNQKLFNEEMKKIWLNSYKNFSVDNIHWKWRDELLSFIETIL
jgi:GTP-binding protein